MFKISSCCMQLIPIIILLLFGSQSVFANTKMQKNIALGKKYTWNKIPSYQLCSKDPDKKKLTDGIYSSAKKCFWMQEHTVGWVYKSPHITIDLGQDMPISGASFSTAAGRAGVTFPRHIFIMVSMDGENFYLAGDLMGKTGENVPRFDSEGYRTFTYRSTDIKSHGRYVRFLPCVGSSPFVFIDELEVYEGKKNFLSLAYKGKSFAGNEIPKEIIIDACAKIRFGDDIQAVRKELKKSSISGKIKKRIASKLDVLSKRIPDIDMDINAKTFRAIVPFNAFHQKIIALHGDILKAEGYKPLTVWSRYRYSPLNLLEKPIDNKPSLQVRMMQNEYRADVFNITNAGNKLTKIKFTIKDIPDCVEVRQVEYVDTANSKIAATALNKVPYSNGEYETTVYAGMTKQIWLTFYPKNISGVYKGTIIIRADKFKTSIPLKLQISEFRLPDKIDLKVAVWDYAINLINGISPANQSAVIKDMKTHRVNVAVGHRKEAAIPNSNGVDKNGHLTKPLDFTNFDKWIKIWDGAGQYQMFLAIRPKTTFAGLKPGTPAFNTAVKEWGMAWDKHLKKVNIKSKIVQFHFFDEPRNQEDYIILKKWLKPFKAGSKMVEVYNDPVHLDKSGFAALKALSYCDVLCPMLRQYLKYDTKIVDFFDNQIKKGKEVWFYSCDGPNRFYDPAYFRLQPWYCFKYGASGSMIWAYSDYSNNWNEYTVMGSLSYSMVYLDPNSTTPTKHWEAFREGIQDYAYLRILEKELPKASPKQLAKISSIVGSSDANQIMQNIVNGILKEDYFEKGKKNFGWKKKSPCKIADLKRIFVLDILQKLEK